MAQARAIKDSWLDEYLRYTNNQAAPEVFHRWIGLTVLAGAVRRHVWMQRPKSQLYPNLYTILVAPSGVARKSTACDIGVNLLREADIGVKVLDDKSTPEGLAVFLENTEVKISSNNHREVALKSAAVDLGVKQKDLQALINELKVAADNTSKNEVVVEPQCTGFIYAPELATFLGNQSYNTGLIDNLTRWYDSPKFWNAITKNKTKITKLTNVNVNWLGASTPEWLARGLGSDTSNGGFTGRIFFIYQGESDRDIWWDKSDKEEESRIKHLLLNDLRFISALEGEIRIEAEVEPLIEGWCRARTKQFGEQGGYTSRWQNHILKIAILLSVSRNDELVITRKDAIEAQRMLVEIEPGMKEALAYVGATNEARIGNYIYDVVCNAGGRIEHRFCFAAVRHMVRSVREFTDIMSTLREEKKIFLNMDGDGYYETESYRTAEIIRKEDAERKKKEAQQQKKEEPKEEEEPVNDDKMTALLSKTLKSIHRS